MSALDSRVGDNTSKILAVTGTGGQIQSLYTFAGDNYNAIQSNTTLIRQVEAEFEQRYQNLNNLSNTLAGRVQSIDTRLNTVEAEFEQRYQNLNNLSNTLAASIQANTVKYNNLNNYITNTGNIVQSVITQQNILRNKIEVLETAPKPSIFVRSDGFALKNYENGQMLVLRSPFNYDPIRVVMKAIDTITGFVYVVNPGSDYGFNFRHATQFDNKPREIEVAVGSTGLYLMTNSGARRNILTGQRRDRFTIYAIMEFVTNEVQSTMGQYLTEATDDGSLNF